MSTHAHLEASGGSKDGGAAPSRRVLVLGATGYVGGLLVPVLLERGHAVRCLVRDPAKLAGRPWAADVEILRGDALDLESLPAAFRGIEAIYYLIHSMGSGAGADYVRRDRQAASNVALVAREQAVGRILYLAGLGAEEGELSEHLASRREVERVLAGPAVPLTVFRAAVIVGAGSVSFQMVRYLAERLPVLITPRWVSTRIQPVAQDDVLRYLADALSSPDSLGRTFEIGGSDVLTYGDMIRVYSRMRGLRRALIPVPVLTPKLSSYWVGLVTPISSSIAIPLIQGMKSEVVVTDPAAREVFPFEPLSYEEAVRRVLAESPRP
ncbi:MAG: NAD(P)H-binding protein [Thermoleophilia bacterium]